jgi:four helix bundle protein
MNEFQDNLKKKMDEYARFVYRITKKFPREEIYGITSQSRRAALSVILNYIEGFARQKRAVKRNFWETSYGSLQESKYLVFFSHREGYVSQEDYNYGDSLAEEIGAMLWTCLKPLYDDEQ